MLSIVLTSGCAEPADADVAASDADSQALIRDGKSGGKAGFFFLPPIARNRPSSSGKFESRLAPVVKIDQVDGQGATVATVATLSGESLRRNVRQQFYVARFKSANNLDTQRNYRIRVFGDAKGRELGFADLDLVSSRSAANRVNRANYVPLVRGNTLAIRFRIDTNAVDSDGDGVFDWLDNCPTVKNAAGSIPADVAVVTLAAPAGCDSETSACDPQEQALNPIAPKQPDADGDGVGDACDCPPGFLGDGKTCTPNDQPTLTLTQPSEGETLSAVSQAWCTAGGSAGGVAVSGTIDGSPSRKATVQVDGGPATALTLTSTALSGCVPLSSGAHALAFTVSSTVTTQVVTQTRNVTIVAGAGNETPTTPPAPIDGAIVLQADLDLDNIRSGVNTLTWTLPAGSFVGYELRCTEQFLDDNAAAETRNAWWDAARPVALAPEVTPPVTTAVVVRRVGDTSYCVLRAKDSAGQLTPVGPAADLTIPFTSKRFTSGSAGQSAGHDFAAVGDVNGDGIDDVLVGGLGEAYLVFGSRSFASGMDPVTPDLTFVGDDATYFGDQVLSLGDFNGDGLNDFAISDFTWNANAGRVLVYYGRPAGNAWPTGRLNVTSGCNADLCFQNGDAGQKFGFSIAAPGNFDADTGGLADLAVGAAAWPSSTTNYGRLYVLLGTTASVAASGNFVGTVTSVASARGFALDGAASATSPGANDTLLLGQSAAGLGEFDSTPGGDLVVTSLGCDTCTPANAQIAGPLTGKAFFVSGRSYTATSGLQALTFSDVGFRAAGVPNGTFFASGSGNFGSVVLALGNVYEPPTVATKGVLDIALWRFSDSGFNVYPGEMSFAPESKILVASATATPEIFSAGFGGFDSKRGDLDGDGRSELYVAYDQGFGFPVPTPAVPTPPIPSASLWYADVFAQNINGDGAIDESTATKVSALSGAGATGRVVDFVGDINGDGKPDIAVGSPGANIDPVSTFGSGEFTLLF